MGGTYDQDFTIQMFRADEPGSENALDARTILGPQWQDAITKPKATFFGNWTPFDPRDGPGVGCRIHRFDNIRSGERLGE